MKDEHHPFTRLAALERIRSGTSWDILIIGGGATGLGCAVDAASRGLNTLLLEQSDFAKGTSSRSTKLIHGGVRYLAQGNITLVYEALRERGRLLKNAPHLVRKIPFIIPCYKWLSRSLYYLGLKFYDWLAGGFSLGATRLLSASEVINYVPTIHRKDLKGGVLYYDAQFDDARLAVNLARTASQHSGVVINYFKVTSLIKDGNGCVTGVRATDLEDEKTYELHSKVVINATGVFADDILEMDDPGTRKMIQPSQGIHIVIDRSLVKGNHALLVPRTTDGRVLFIIPWYHHLLVGTTDTPIRQTTPEPEPLKEEFSFILNNVKEYIAAPLHRENILSVFAGLRPLAAPVTNAGRTRELSRSHKLIVSESKLVTITGGKWTTYRKMAEDTINQCIRTAEFHGVLPCQTRSLKIWGYEEISPDVPFYWYGSDRFHLARLIESRPELGERLSDALPFVKAEVIWAVRQEMARTVDDILARRLRALFIDARASMEAAPAVAALMAGELGYDRNWIEKQVSAFRALATRYLPEFIASELPPGNES